MLLPKLLNTRKVRIGRKGSGKSGGFRIFYFLCPNMPKIFCIYAIDKRKQENLKPKEKVFVKQITAELTILCKKTIPMTIGIQVVGVSEVYH